MTFATVIKRTPRTCPWTKLPTVPQSYDVGDGGGNDEFSRGKLPLNDGQLLAFLRRYTEAFRRFVKFICTHRKHRRRPTYMLRWSASFLLHIAAFIRLPIVQLAANIYRLALRNCCEQRDVKWEGLSVNTSNINTSIWRATQRDCCRDGIDSNAVVSRVNGPLMHQRHCTFDRVNL